VPEVGQIVFVAGEPALFLTRRERLWKAAVIAAGVNQLSQPALHFVVGSFLRMGQPFDVDNLAKPVLECLGGRPTSVWVTVKEGTGVGVHVTSIPPPPAPLGALEFYVKTPRSRSARPVVQMGELADLPVLGTADQSIGLELAFDADEAIADFGFNGPVKPLIDGMENILGPGPHGPADHRIKDLRIRKGRDPAHAGVTIRVWLISPNK
jgi:hypothetical protein